MYTLFGTRGSGSAAAEMGLRACAVPWRFVRAARWEKDSAFDELLQLNPLGQVPTLLLPRKQVLTQSAAILMHLGLEHPASRLLPATAAKRAQVLHGLVFIAANCYAAISVADYPERWCEGAGEALRKRVRAAARGQLHAAWDLFADQFGARPFLTGTVPGALDMLAVVVSRWSGARAHLATSRPQFLQLLHRIEGHPRVHGVMVEHFDPVAAPR